MASGRLSPQAFVDKQFSGIEAIISPRDVTIVRISHKGTEGRFQKIVQTEVVSEIKFGRAWAAMATDMYGVTETNKMQKGNKFNIG